jgi:hypothetical protein
VIPVGLVAASGRCDSLFATGSGDDVIPDILPFGKVRHHPSSVSTSRSFRYSSYSRSACGIARRYHQVGVLIAQQVPDQVSSDLKRGGVNAATLAGNAYLHWQVQWFAPDSQAPDDNARGQKMITTIALLKARPGMTHDEFVDYYENHHVPLILRAAPAPSAYSRTYLPPGAERRFEADFDVMTRLRFEDDAARQSWLARVYADGSGVAEDEERFLDRARTRSWVVDERVTTGG